MKRTLIIIIAVLFAITVISCKNSTEPDPKNNNIDILDFSSVKQLEIADIDQKADSVLSVLEGFGRHIVYEDYLDADSIIHIPNKYFDGFHPVAHAHAMNYLYDCIMGDENAYDYRGVFIKNLSYIEEQLTEDFYAEYKFDHSHFGVPMGDCWISGMAQGELLGVFCRGYVLTNDTHYLEVAEKFFNTLIKNFDPYWCVFIDENNYYWIEEYPNPDKCHVLNGKLYALWGVFEYYAITRDEKVKTAFQAGVKSIVDNFDECWLALSQPRSMYCSHSLASEGYHNLHINQFKFMNKYLNLSDFDSIIRKLESKPLN